MLSSNGATDLWAACWKGHLDVVEFLIAQPDVDLARARIELPGDDNTTPTVPHPGTTPLQVAVQEGHTAIADLLWEHLPL